MHNKYHIHNLMANTAMFLIIITKLSKSKQQEIRQKYSNFKNQNFRKLEGKLWRCASWKSWPWNKWRFEEHSSSRGMTKNDSALRTKQIIFIWKYPRDSFKFKFKYSRPGFLQSDSAKIQIDFLSTISPCFEFQSFRYY